MNAFLADFLAADFERDDLMDIVGRHRDSLAGPRLEEARQAIARAMPEPRRSLLGWLRR